MNKLKNFSLKKIPVFFYVNFKSKITIANRLFLIPAIIHFITVIIIQLKNGEFNALQLHKEEYISFITIKLISLLTLVIFYQLILIVIKGFRVNNTKIKQITKYFLIYFIPNLMMFFIIFPGLHSESSFIISQGIIGYNLTFDSDLDNFLPILLEITEYNLIPAIFGIGLCNTFIFSLILGYIIYLLKKKLNYKYAELMYIPFLFPHVLILNTYPFRVIYSSYLFILVFSIILISYKNSPLSSPAKTNVCIIILAVLSSILAVIRSEYILLFLFIPLMIYSLKIYDKKRFFMFLIFFLISFSFFFFEIYYEKQKAGNNMYYELHNCGMIYGNYEDIINNNTNEYEKQILASVYPKKPFDANFILSDKYNAKHACYIIIKTVIKNTPVVFKQRFNNYINPINLILSEPTKVYNHSINKQLRAKFVNYLTSPESKYSFISYKIMSNPVIYYVFLGLILILGFISKNYFYVWFSIIFIPIYSLILLTAPLIEYLYVYPCYISAYWLFIVFILDLIKLLRNKIGEI